MKTLIINYKRLVFICFTFLIIFFGGQMPGYSANLNVGEPRTVRLIYFLPNDWPFRSDVVQDMKNKIRIVQDFYAEQMQAHGHGKKTFHVETNARGKPVVHRVNGQHPFSHYDNTLGSTVISEIEQMFDLKANIYFIVLGTDALRQGNGVPAGGVGYRWSKNGGTVLVPNEFSWDTVAHELGHAFGVDHDFRDNAYIMSYSREKNQLSACTAEFMAVHSYFNADIPIEETSPPTIELMSPQTYPAETTSVTIQLKISDFEGLHQVRLHTRGELITCREFIGKKDTVFEFEYDGTVPSNTFGSLHDPATHVVHIQAIDIDGNLSNKFFRLSAVSPSHIATLNLNHEGPYVNTDIAFSPDGTTLASILGYAADFSTSRTMSQAIGLWDVAIGERIASFTSDLLPLDYDGSVAFSPDGSILASGIGHEVQLLDVATRQNIATLEAHKSTVGFVSFSPDGTTLASVARADDTIKLWNIATKQNIATLKGDGSLFVNSVAFSPDGTTLAVISHEEIKDRWVQSSSIRLWDTATQQNIATFKQPKNPAWYSSLAFSPNGTTLAVGTTQVSGGNRIILWNMTTGKHISDIPLGRIEGVLALAFSPDGRTLASSLGDVTIKLWDVKTRVHITTLKGHTDPILSVAFSPDGTLLASAGLDALVMLWDMSGITRDRSEALTKVNIPDSNLRDVVTTALGKQPSDPILQADMAALTELDAPNANIRDLTGIAYAYNLEKLNLGSEYISGEGRVNSNTISDFSPLVKLTKLKRLNLSFASISDVSFLSGLTRLAHLNLDGNAITDAAPLAGLTQLTRLLFSSDAISDISPLAGLARLEVLFLNSNSVSDLSALSSLTQLRELIISGTSISDVSPLSELTQLTLLVLAVSSISDISPLADLTTLAHLDLYNNRISDVSALASLKQLRRLDLRGNAIRDVSPLVELDLPGTELYKTGLYIKRNPLNYASVHTHIPAMQAKGVEVSFDNHAHSALVKVSDDTQKGEAGTTLATPFVVKAMDPHGAPMAGLSVAFRVIEGEGRLSARTTTTDANGRAQTTLTLGPNPGVNMVRVTASQITYPVTFTAIATDAPRLVADVNRDGGVNVLDLITIVSRFDQMGPDSADVNGDGIVNLLDLVLVAGALEGGAAVAPALQSSEFEGFSAAEIQSFLTQARQLALTDPTYLRGIMVLEQLLITLIPEETVLLANYPNPFNPETWIPYQLAESANVTLHIHSVNGVLVRTLALGYQPAGVYQSRTRAAYWDGRNEQAEHVASGVYFYTLSTGHFTATRKLLIRK